MKIAESEKASINFRLNESQKVFLLPAQRAAPLYCLKVVAILFVNYQKTTQAVLFRISTEGRYFFNLELILLRLFLKLFFVAETGVVPQLFLNFEQK